MLLLLVTCDTFSVNTPRPEKYPLLAKRILDTTSQEKKGVYEEKGRGEAS
jgi:hypothetical protein